MTAPLKNDIVLRLKSEILRLQGFKPSHAVTKNNLSWLKNAFPEGAFPLAASHEFLYSSAEDLAATSGFICALISSLLGSAGTTLWIHQGRPVFPPALKSFGLTPDHVLFVDVRQEKELWWVIEEALKCPAVGAVIGEVKNMDFNASRRLQLATEQSLATAFIIRPQSKSVQSTACVSRWKISSIESDAIDDLPGLGHPCWKADLLKIKNGKPSHWNLKWHQGSFREIEKSIDSGVPERIHKLA